MMKYDTGQKMICGSWYWLSSADGKLFKICSLNYNCPNNGDYICGVVEETELKVEVTTNE